ncbi:MAG: hypothetical protein II155_02845 [Clostridia bacterium]|nr:hypothetical protein [Clostridia bacterium]
MSSSTENATLSTVSTGFSTEKLLEMHGFNGVFHNRRAVWKRKIGAAVTPLLTDSTKEKSLSQLISVIKFGIITISVQSLGEPLSAGIIIKEILP